MQAIDLDKIRTYKDDFDVDCCLICNKPLKERDFANGKGHYLHWLPDGTVTDTEVPVKAGWELGWWQVGCSCYKRFKQIATKATVEQFENEEWFDKEKQCEQ